MERIQKAISRAKEEQSLNDLAPLSHSGRNHSGREMPVSPGGLSSSGLSSSGLSSSGLASSGFASSATGPMFFADLELLPTSLATLQANRIINFTRGTHYSAAFDMLRTKIMRDLLASDWQTLLVTSPTAGCGKTVTAINLAISMARQPETQVCLIDLDLRRPSVAASLGISPPANLTDALDGVVTAERCFFGIDIVGPNLALAANLRPAQQSVETLLSRQMQELLNSLRNASPRPILIFDMPPVLSCDDVLAFLPQIDCSILCVAEGHSTIKEIENSQKLLSETNFLGCVLTKSTERVQTYY